VTAVYSGNANFATSTGTSQQTVNAAATTTTITGTNPSSPAVTGQPVAINFTVAPTAPGAGTPTGPVTITASTGETCTGQLGAGGSGTCTIIFTTPGPRTFTATFAGTANFAGSTSTSATPFTVNQGPNAGLEGDVAPRFEGDGVYRSNDVEQERRFVAGIDQPNGVTNEFQRADVAPYATKGDGRLRADDLQTELNYVAALVDPQTAGGPTQPIAGTAPLEEREAGADKTGRTMRIVNSEAPVGESGRTGRTSVAVAVEIDSLGDETVALFTLNFDPSRLSNPVVTLAEGMPEGFTLTSSTRDAGDGKVTVLLDSSTPFTTSFSTRVVTVTFDVVKGSPVGDTQITFDGSGSFSDALARSLMANYEDGIINILGTKSR